MVLSTAKLVNGTSNCILFECPSGSPNVKLTLGSPSSFVYALMIVVSEFNAFLALTHVLINSLSIVNS